jgi:hypothetical protein
MVEMLREVHMGGRPPLSARYSSRVFRYVGREYKNSLASLGSPITGSLEEAQIQ